MTDNFKDLNLDSYAGICPICGQPTQCTVISKIDPCWCKKEEHKLTATQIEYLKEHRNELLLKIFDKKSEDVPRDRCNCEACTRILFGEVRRQTK